MTKLSLLVCAGLLLAGPAFAHHSPVVFDQAREVTLSGVVREFRWTNPHSWIDLEVRTSGGEVESWSVEMTSPNHLVRAGWRSTTLEPGDEVTVVVNPLRTGEKIGKFVSVTLADGQVFRER